MPIRPVPAILIASLLAACGSDATSPSPTVDVTGTFIGDYTATVTPATVYQGVLQLAQTGGTVTGTLTTNAGRSANVSGHMSRARITATFTFTDGCNGTASATVDATNNGTQLSGNYSANDCAGQYTGGFLLLKQ